MNRIEECERLIEESRKELNKLNEEMGFIHDEMYGFNKYHHSKIYKIVSDNTDKIYIGSTTQPLKERLRLHVAKYKMFLNDNYHYVTSFKVLEFGNYQIELIKNVCVSNKKELELIESDYIRKTTNIINKYIPCRNRKEYRKDNKEKIKNIKSKYYESNKSEINEKKKIQYKCACGSTLSKNCKARHERSPRHQKFMQIQP